MYTLRPIQPSHYTAACAIYNRSTPDPVSVEVFTEWCQLDPLRNIRYHQLVAERADGQIVGYVIACHNEWMAPHQWYVKVTVAPEECGRGVGTLLYQRAEELACAAGATELLSGCEGGAEESFAWAERRGFVCTRQRAKLVLNLQDWSAEPFRPAVSRQGGLRLESVREITAEPLLRELYDFESTTVPDAPYFQPPFAPYEKWVKWFVGKERDRTPTVTVLAFDGGCIAGISRVSLPRVPGQGAKQGFTGVRREYRGRGLSLAMKVLATEAAQQAGASHIRTTTDDDNPAMLAVNMRLGFRRVPGPRDLVKRIP